MPIKERFHGLKQSKLRQSWNKFNLYNLAQHSGRPRAKTETMFQRKWAAKAMTRAYHGETVRETLWRRRFKPGSRSVVPMNDVYLARSDGSELATGRGRGLDQPPGGEGHGSRGGTATQWPSMFSQIPYMNMVYNQLERRLDTAVFRAMFASSTRQARQFVIHGYVKVNGEKMIYPGYQLNPGDMFQVDPERVLYATGAPKSPEERKAGRRERRAKAKGATEEEGDSATPEPSSTGDGEPASTEPSPSDPTVKTDASPKAVLSSLIAQAKSILANDPSASAKRKQELRSFQRLVRTHLGSTDRLAKDGIDASLAELTAKLDISLPPPRPNASSTAADGQQSITTPSSNNNNSDPYETDNTPYDPSIRYQPRRAVLPRTQTIISDEERLLRAALQEARDNPIDNTKPYATPWRPRPWMSAFAFIPRYLEVHHPICSAVYLRHPEASPGRAEVPSPFPEKQSALAFSWYLRRR